MNDDWKRLLQEFLKIAEQMPTPQQAMRVTYHLPPPDILDYLHNSWPGGQAQVEYATLEARLMRRVYDEV